MDAATWLLLSENGGPVPPGPGTADMHRWPKFGCSYQQGMTNPACDPTLWASLCRDAGVDFTRVWAMDAWAVGPNGDGTVSAQKANGKWLCVTPDGQLEERDSPGGLWESFVRGNSSLIAYRDGGASGPKVYVLPLAE